MTRPSAEQFFVYCPIGARTGGPEALHQLVDQMRSLGLDAHLAPARGTEAAEPVAEYARYDAPIHRGPLPDRATTTVIAPEESVPMARGFKNARIVIWWLSIDGSTTEMLRTAFLRGDGWNLGLWKLYLWRLKRDPRQANRWANMAVLRCARHLAQSQYAIEYLRMRYGLTAGLLSDYTDADVDAAPRQTSATSPPVVAYNPAKGGSSVRQLMAGRGDVEWVELAGLTQREVRQALARSDLYIDLGHHPGKDRLPREAASAGCGVLTNRAGSAGNWLDLPIPFHYKMDFVRFDLEKARQCLDDALRDPARVYADQRFYRQVIAAERDQFRREVQRIFLRGEWANNEPAPVHGWLAEGRRGPLDDGRLES